MLEKVPLQDAADLNNEVRKVFLSRWLFLRATVSKWMVPIFLDYRYIKKWIWCMIFFCCLNFQQGFFFFLNDWAQ